MTRSALGTAIGPRSIFAGMWCLIRRGHEPKRNPLGTVCVHCGKPGDLDELGTMDDVFITKTRQFDREHGFTRADGFLH